MKINNFIIILIINVIWGLQGYNPVTDETDSIYNFVINETDKSFNYFNTFDENQLLYNSRDIDFIQHNIADHYNGTSSVFQIDMDNDSDLDIIACHRDSDYVTWHENDGSGNFIHHIIDDYNTDVYFATGGDIDNDGDIDVFSISLTGNTITFFQNDGEQNFTEYYIDNVENGRDIHIKDIDNDGDSDLIVASYEEGLLWYENDGAQNFTQIIIDNIAVYGKYSNIEIFDLDNDNDLDLVVAGQTTELRTFINDGSANFTSIYYDLPIELEIWNLHSDDVDNDGDTDIISVFREADQIMWHENDGFGNFTNTQDLINIIGPFDINSADLDCDGDIDLFTTSGIYDDIYNFIRYVSVFENDGEQNFEIGYYEPYYGGGMMDNIISADFDGDNDIDIVANNRSPNHINISLFENLSNCNSCPETTGDINDDSSVDVLDVLLVVDLLLNGGFDNYDFCADINSDGNLDVMDIINLVSIILDNSF